MRIGLVTHTLFPEFIGGREKHVQELAKLLSEKHDVCVFTGSIRKKVTIEDRDGYRIYNIPLISISLPDREIYKFIPKFFDTLKKEKLDIIHAHDYGHFSTDVANLFSIKEKVPLVLTIHGHYFRHPLLKIMKSTYDKLWGYKTIKNSRKIICVSEVQKQEICEPFNSLQIESKTVVVPNGITLRKFKKTKSAENIVLSTGRLVYRKGFHTLVEASKYIENSKIIIAGPNGGEGSRLEGMIVKNNLNNKIELLDAVKENNLDDLLSKCSVFVIPSLYEGLPTTLLEAMMFGKPVVCSDLLGIRSVVKDGVNGFLVEPENSEMLARKINILLENNILSKKIGNRNQKDVLKYDWRKIVKNIESIYNQVIL